MHCKRIHSMAQVSRRRFIKTLGAAALATAATPLRAGARHRDDIPALVVGSGFGGSIAAFRLAEYGIPTVVLERGRRWDIQADGNTFATLANPDERLVWFDRIFDVPGLPVIALPEPPFAGVLEVLRFPDVTVLNGAGVGGGSLVYGTTLVAPPAEFFRRFMPRRFD